MFNSTSQIHYLRPIEFEYMRPLWTAFKGTHSRNFWIACLVITNVLQLNMLYRSNALVRLPRKLFPVMHTEEKVNKLHFFVCDSTYYTHFIKRPKIYYLKSPEIVNYNLQLNKKENITKLWFYITCNVNFIIFLKIAQFL